MSIIVRARFDVREGGQAEFEEIAFALRERAADEPGTLGYRWFSAGGGSYVVIEEYVDGAAAFSHNERAADLLARVPECAEMVSAELYGPVEPELAEWVRSTPGVTAYPELTAAAG